MTRDTEEFSQKTESVACREYILQRDEKLTDPKGWIRGNTKIGPVLEVTTSYLQGKYGVEIKNYVYEQRQFSLLSQNFSWIKQICGTEKSVKSGQSVGLFTQLEEIDIDFRVSGLPHAVVKQAENSRVRELVKKIESHPHRPCGQ